MRPLLLLLFLASIVGSPAAEIAGRYVDKGTAVPTESEQTPGEMSLHALLQLDLNYARSHDLYADTAYVEFQQGRETLVARMYGDDDEILSQGAWSAKEGYSVEDGQVVLRLRGAQHGGNVFVCVMTLVGEQKLLQVEVSRASTTALGPTAQRVGTYLFPRLE